MQVTLKKLAESSLWSMNGRACYSFAWSYLCLGVEHVGALKARDEQVLPYLIIFGTQSLAFLPKVAKPAGLRRVLLLVRVKKQVWLVHLSCQCIRASRADTKHVQTELPKHAST